MLVEVDNLVGVVDTTIGHLANMHQTVLMHTDVDKSAESCDIGDNARQHHAFLDIFDACDVLVELEHLEFGTWVETWFFQLFHYILQCRHAAVIADEVLQAYLRAQFLILHKRLHV